MHYLYLWFITLVVPHIVFLLTLSTGMYSKHQQIVHFLHKTTTWSYILGPEFILLFALIICGWNQAKGHDTRSHTLACFGGAGAQHACAIARALGMTRVAIHKYAGILSALGMACADVVQEAQVPAACSYDSGKYSSVIINNCWKM